MKINNLKINGFGNIRDKQIDLSDRINVIYGENESGKSTFLKFIINIFYGASKNKKGKDISDFEKYKPWNIEEFSGKVTYTLDNDERYEVYREFKSKNPKIYNDNLEEISKEFNIDKGKGNEFFYEQTGVDEDTLISSIASMQQEVKLDEKNQNMIIQKIANIVSTGNDNISLKKAMDILNKRMLSDVGTERTQDRPINIAIKKYNELQKEKKELISFIDEKYEIEDKKQCIEREILKNERDLHILKDIKSVKEKEKIEEEKTNITSDINYKNEEKIRLLEKEKKEIEDLINKKKKENNKKNTVNNVKEKSKMNVLSCVCISIILLILTVLSYVFIKNMIVSVILAICFILNLVYIFSKIRVNKNKDKIRKSNIKIDIENYTEGIQEIENEKTKVEKEIEILSESIKENEEKIISIKNNIHSFIEENKKEIINRCYIDMNKTTIENEKDNEIDVVIKFINENINNKELEEINKYIEELSDELNNNKLKLHSLEINRKNILPKLENLANIDEMLEEKKEELEELDIRKESINLAKQTIENSHNRMRNNITPKFTTELSNIINEISGGKYKKVKLNSENGLIVEIENGSYIPVELLSVGTIDQLYLSLRLAILKEIAKEDLPIILDESFAYYDDERLKNILKYLSKNINNQVIILTCTNREEKILREEGLEHNIIKL